MLEINPEIRISWKELKEHKLVIFFYKFIS